MKYLYPLVKFIVAVTLLTGCGVVEAPAGPAFQEGAESAVPPTVAPNLAAREEPTALVAQLASAATELPTAESAVQQEATSRPTSTPTFTPTSPPPTKEPTKTPTRTPQPTATHRPAPVPTTLPATAPPPTPGPAADVVSSLRSLPIDDFFEESYAQLLLRYPEYLTYLGLTEAFGQRDDRLNNLSDAYLRETQELESAILDLLRTFDRSKLTPEQQMSYDIYEWYLDGLVRGHQFMYYNYPVHDYLSGWHDDLIGFFTLLHPLADRQDAEDYIARLSQVDEQAGQLLDGLKRRKKAGAILPAFMVSRVVPELREIAESEARATPFYSAFRRRLSGIEGLTDAEEQRLLKAARIEIDKSVIPAFQALAEYFVYLGTVATDDAGVWKFPEGDAYYAYRLRREASVDITPEEAHELGLAEVSRIQSEIREEFDELGYPQDAGFGRLMERARREAGSLESRTQEDEARVVEAYESLIHKADEAVGAVFDIRPEADVIVVGDSFGGYYQRPALDGSRPGAFHATIGGSTRSKFNMATITYHETVPGHHFQLAIAQEQDLPLFQKVLSFNGFGEGWALYAERLAWEMGLYDKDPYGNLGRLQLELLRAVRVVVDTGIHAKGWTRTEARGYMRRAVGDPMGHWSHEVERYVVFPAQATGYTIGMLKILELRQYASDELGDRFDIKAFHNAILMGGSKPLDVLEKAVQGYVEANR